MADTIPLLNLRAGQFLDVYAATAIPVGTEILIQAYSTTTVIDVHISDVQPSSDSTMKFGLFQADQTAIEADESGVWVRSRTDSLLSVQVLEDVAFLFENNGDYGAGTFTLGVSWSPMQMTALGNSGSYSGDAARFLSRRLASPDGANIMVGNTVIDADTFTYSTNNSEQEVRDAFSSPNSWVLSPDIWYMNSNNTASTFFEGVDTSRNFMVASGASATVPGNWEGRAQVLLGLRLRSQINDAVIIVEENQSPNRFFYSSENSDNEIQAGFQHPNQFYAVERVFDFNGDFDGVNWVNGVNWTEKKFTSETTTTFPSPLNGSYFNESSRIYNRKAVSRINGSVVMLLPGSTDSELDFATGDTEANIQAGFEYQKGMEVQPDIFYMNGDVNSGNFVNGVNWTDKQMTGLAGDSHAGNYAGRSGILPGHEYTGENGAVIQITAILDANTVSFTTSNTEAEVNTGFGAPNIWQRS